MSILKGQREYDRFLDGKTLTRKQSILANCYVCNGLDDSKNDCEGKSCPLYPVSHYAKRKKRVLRAEQGSFLNAQDKEKVL